MKFSEDRVNQGYHITAYERGMIMVSGNPKTSSFIISLDRLIEDWEPEHVDQLRSRHVQPLLDLEPELVLIGTGENLRFPAIEHYASLIQLNIGVELMDSAAACRTYNVLLNEGRKVVAGIIVET